ncbi:hypothetical protein RFI_21004, partial [Reticulomyxa filosa]
MIYFGQLKKEGAYFIYGKKKITKNEFIVQYNIYKGSESRANVASENTSGKQNTQPKKGIKKPNAPKDVENKHGNSEKNVDIDNNSDNDNEFEEKEQMPIEQDRQQPSEFNTQTTRRISDEIEHKSIVPKKTPDVKFQSDTLYQPNKPKKLGVNDFKKKKKRGDVSSPATIQNEEESVSYSDSGSENENNRSEKDKDARLESGKTEIEEANRNVAMGGSIGTGIGSGTHSGVTIGTGTGTNIGSTVTGSRKVEVVSLGANMMPMTDAPMSPKVKKKGYTIQLEGADLDTQTDRLEEKKSSSPRAATVASGGTKSTKLTATTKKPISKSPPPKPSDRKHSNQDSGQDATGNRTRTAKSTGPAIIRNAGV